MTNPVVAGARAAAGRLSARYGSGLPSEVEVVLLEAESVGESSQYIDPISLASLIVSVASLAWSICSEQRANGFDLAVKDLIKAVRTALRNPDDTRLVPQPEIIEVVVTEIDRAKRQGER
jgi:hypothetical protein